MGYVFFYKALEKGKASIVSPVLSTFGGFAVIISFFVFKEPISILRWVGLGIILLGIILTAIVIENQNSITDEKKGFAKGLPETIVGIILFSIFFPFWDNFVSTVGSWAFLVLGLRLVLALVAFIYSKQTKISLYIKDASLWKFLIIIGLFDGSAYLALTWGFGASTQTSVTTMLSAAYSLPTIILARLFLKERLSRLQWIGVFFIIAGLVYVSGTA